MGMHRKKADRLSAVSRMSIEKMVDAANESMSVEDLRDNAGLTDDTPGHEVRRAGEEFGYDLLKFVNVDRDK